MGFWGGGGGYIRSPPHAHTPLPTAPVPAGRARRCPATTSRQTPPRVTAAAVLRSGGCAGFADRGGGGSFLCVAEAKCCAGVGGVRGCWPLGVGTSCATAGGGSAGWLVPGATLSLLMLYTVGNMFFPRSSLGQGLCCILPAAGVQPPCCIGVLSRLHVRACVRVRALRPPCCHTAACGWGMCSPSCCGASESIVCVSLVCTCCGGGRLATGHLKCPGSVPAGAVRLSC